jgi:vesicular inhibitory amino acid transporter
MSIPIEQAGQRPHTADHPRLSAGQSLLQSSLDVVLSYSRSQTFLGSQLPSSPSFVDERRRRGYDHDTSEAGEEEEEEDLSDEEDEDDYGRSLTTKSSEDQLGNLSGVQEDDDDDGDDNDSDDHHPSAFGVFEEDVPRSSSANYKKRRRIRRAPHGPTSHHQRHHRAAAANHNRSDESSPLLLRTPPSHQPPGLGASPPDGVPFPRLSRALSAELRRKGAAVDDHGPHHRRHAASPEDEMYGSSTFGQSLFNSINVLVGVGILAERVFSNHDRKSIGWT